MAAPFCPACGAAVADGVRFCAKCGQPVGQAAPPPPPPPVQPYVAPPAAESAIQPAKKGAGAGVWIGILGILLLLGGAGLWVYSTHRPAAPVEVAQTPAPAPPAAPPIPEAIPPNPDFAQPEVIPPNPDFAKKDEAPASPSSSKSRPAQTKQASDPPVPAAPRPAAKAANPTSGTLHATVEVAQNGEVVFENLPGARLKFTFDHAAWKPTISHQPNGTQTLVMRSLKPGIQTSCDVQWEIIQ